MFPESRSAMRKNTVNECQNILLEVDSQSAFPEKHIVRHIGANTVFFAVC